MRPHGTRVVAVVLAALSGACAGADAVDIEHAEHPAVSEPADGTGQDRPDDPDEEPSRLVASERSGGRFDRADGADGADGADRGRQGCDDEQIDVNAASAADLERIIHIGSARAEQVPDLRPFVDTQDLIRISGIGEKRLADIIEQGLACAG